MARLILKAVEMGYEVTLGDAYRSPEEASRFANLGVGITNSLHTVRLAIDLNLFKEGKYLTYTAAYSPLGEWWEKQSTEAYTCCWGGHFKDGNHFSIEHQGVR